MSMYFINKKLTPLNLYIAISRLKVCREVCALSSLKECWDETRGIFNRIFFLIKAILFIIPATFILIKSLISSIITLYKQVKGVIEGTTDGVGFPFTPDETYRKTHFYGNYVPTKNNNVKLEDLGAINHNPTYISDRVKQDLFKANRRGISVASKMIRKSLIQNDYVLTGMILDTKFPNLKIEELLEVVRGNIPMGTYLIQKIDFGILNKPIKELFSEIVIRKLKLNGGSYLILKDNDVNKLENSLREVFMNNKIKIKLVKEENTNGRTN